ncbi:DeoR/GlpR family DNA-binding transcription regulator [Desemzia sp. C1]|uniref:DeoR/GlpR family DNA-binding transcription regulator n=1 Tax=Desemzia sp. C1 TaxID=2892016 RepID=UPI001E3A61F4|nr:DeoR/GlpR family DNA-binding transcription regulator [Desemzia sp. C1]MCI3027587.1 DeoR/GlpR family DNA-binding transcription regulator [Desemzia sp. C1]
MLTEERYQYILDQLTQHGLVKSQELIKEMNCSESTLRRDLDALEEKGMLVRVHGGAKRLYEIEREIPITEKTSKNIQEKKEIAEYASSLVQDGDTIFLDAGTTTLYMIPFLKQKKIRIVTNAVQHAHLLADQENEVVLIGGVLKNTTKAVIGAVGCAQLSQYNFNKAFLGINGVDLEYGFTTPDPEEAAIKQQAIKNSAKVFILTDNSKFNTVTFVKVEDIDGATILTNSLNKKEFGAYFEATKIMEVKHDLHSNT